MSKKCTPLDITIGRNIRTVRLSRGITLQALSKTVGVSFQQFRKYEIGTTRLSAAALYGIATALNCPLESLYANSIEFENGNDRMVMNMCRLMRRIGNRNICEGINELLKSLTPMNVKDEKEREEEDHLLAQYELAMEKKASRLLSCARPIWSI